MASGAVFTFFLSKYRQFNRHRTVFFRRLTSRKLGNLALRCLAYVLRQPGLPGLPVHLKIDVAPQCQLRCPVCQHSSAGIDDDFRPPALMRIGTFQKIVDDVSGSAIAMALYNLGEPLLHPQLCRMIRYAEERGINTYFTTNLSLKLKDERIREIIDSGASMIIVAVDGVSAQTYGTQRIGGNWELVRNNILRLASYRDLRGNGPRLLLQYLTFDFNAHERDAARKFVADCGFDDIHFFGGDTKPWKKTREVRTGAKQKRAGATPHCAWPFFSMVVNSSGEVSPCCLSRMDDYHLRSVVPRSMGNILKEGAAALYQNPAYQDARRLSANPRRHREAAQGHFCEGCRMLVQPSPSTAARETLQVHSS